MNDFYRQLYENLVQGIDECEKQHTDFRQHIECCFHICESTNQLVDKQLASATFRSEEEEIIFFKHIRPKFSSLVEFYSIIYRAELFLPEGQNAKMQFWKNELQRAENFFDFNKEFYQYIKDGETFRDKEYFLRSSEESAGANSLIAQITARELYVELLKKKIGEEGKE